MERLALQPLLRGGIEMKDKSKLRCHDCRFWYGTINEGCHRYPQMVLKYSDEVICGEFKSW